MHLRPIIIATALQIERDAVLAYVPSQPEGIQDGFAVHRGQINGYPVLTVCFEGMGNVRSARAIAIAVERFSPIAVVLVGIAGGTRKPTSELFDKSQHFLGDVLVAEQVLDYEFGKQTTEGVQHRPEVFRAAARWLAIAKQIRDLGWAQSIKAERPDGSSGRVVPRAHFGVVASGQKVLTTATPLDKVASLFTNLIGVEMEGSGVAFAAHEGTHGPTDFLLVKAICDWADPSKNDVWQPYAANSASAYAVKVIEQFIEEFIPKNNNGDFLSLSQERGLATIQRVNKADFIKRLGDSWEDLSDAVDIPIHEKRKFQRGNEPRAIFEYLEVRNKLEFLPTALNQIGRDDLVEGLPENPS